MIRTLTAADRAPVLQLLRETGNFSPAEVAIADELMEAVLTRPEQRDYHAFVYEHAQSAVGMLIIGPVPATIGTWHLYWIAVQPQQQGTGVAAELASFAEAYIHERGGYLIMVETSSQPAYDRTRRFYAKQGYEQLVRVTDYYRPGDDLVLLARRLPL